jgi:hypothetical protein
MFSFRGDDFNDTETTADNAYPAQFEKLLQDNGFSDIKVEDNTWETRGTLSQMTLAGVADDVVQNYITNHTNAGLTDATETIISDDVADKQTERDDQDAIPVLCMGYFGGWGQSPDELVDQYKQMLSTYSQQDKYIIVGVYPDSVTNGVVNPDDYVNALSGAFSEHFVMMDSVSMPDPAFSDAGHQEIASAIFSKAQELGYLNASASASTDVTLVNDAGDQVTAAKNSDGAYVDASGKTYTDNGDGTWTDSEGGSWKTANSASQNDTSDNASAEAATASYTLKDDSGNTVTVSPDSDGSYFDSNGVAYQNEGSGKWIDENGTTWSES